MTQSWAHLGPLLGLPGSSKDFQTFPSSSNLQPFDSKGGVSSKLYIYIYICVYIYIYIYVHDTSTNVCNLFLSICMHVYNIHVVWSPLGASTARNPTSQAEEKYLSLLV